jgi:hypothetical protein
MFHDVRRELSKIWRSLAEAIERAGRDLAQESPDRVPRARRVGPVPTRLPPPRVRRPVRHPLLLPRRLHRRTARSIDGHEPATPAPAGAQRLADLLRQRLLDLQTALRGLQQRLGHAVEERR